MLAVRRRGGGLVLAHVRARRAVPHVRELGFFQELRKRVSEEMQKNEELQKSLKELREHDALKAAKGVAEKAKESLGKAQASAGEAVNAAKAKAESVKQTVENREEVKEAYKWAETASEKAKEAARKASPSSSGASGADAEASAGGASAADSGSGSGSGSGAPGVSWFQRLSEALGSAPKGAGAAPGPAEGENDSTTTAVVIKPPSMWEQAFNRAQDSPLLGGLLGAFRGLFGVAGNAASSVTDRVLGENENAEALMMLRERDPAFHPEPFLKHMEHVLIPKVIGAYLAGTLPELRAMCVEQAFATLHSNVQARIAQQIFMDRRILDLSGVELVGFRLVNEEPTAVVQFVTQQINCMRDPSGRVVEGAPDDIRAVYYVFALQQREPDDAEPDEATGEYIDPRPSVERWVVTELAIRGAMETW